jgi:carbon monoxide dehydrogenase subunit G
MIEAEHSIAIDAAISGVWDYVQDIRRWANLFPGCHGCELVNEHDSRWTVKVGAGGLVKTVIVLVHVDQWSGPGRVDFSYKLESEPVKGSGSYIASAKGTRETEIQLKLRVEGSGSMAPMWEAMCRPLLPQLAKAFAGKLKIEIEQAAGDAAPQVQSQPSMLAAIGAWLRKLWRSAFGTKTNSAG